MSTKPQPLVWSEHSLNDPTAVRLTLLVDISTQGYSNLDFAGFTPETVSVEIPEHRCSAR